MVGAVPPLGGIQPAMLVVFTIAVVCATAESDAAEATELPAGLLASLEEIPRAGAEVLLPLGFDALHCSGGSTDGRGVGGTAATELLDRNATSSRRASSKGTGASSRRSAFVCAAGCAEHEPQLERSLAPWADLLDINQSGLDMLDMMMGFCAADKSCKDPFVLVALHDGDLYLRACGADDLHQAFLYLIGPEDLSMVIVVLLAAMRVAELPSGPIVFGMYLSDYSCLGDRHLIGPGLPIFAYLTRETSWLIPWPSSFTLYSTKEIEDLHNGSSEAEAASDNFDWAERKAKAFWIGTVTGPWEFAPDIALPAVPRLKLLRLSSQHPEFLQAEWSGVAHYGISWLDDTNNAVKGFLANESHPIEQLTGLPKSEYKRVWEWQDTYKYYLNVDGVVMGGRLNKLMSLGGVVLQHSSGYREHFHALARPYQHYVPLAYDLSDLVPKVKWLQKHDAEAKAVARRAQRLAKQRLRLEDHLCYVWRALEAIGSKVATRPVDAEDVQLQLKHFKFKQVPMVKEDMRATLEAFWGARLELVQTGDRAMNEEGIRLLQWLWDRFGGIYRQSLEKIT